MRVTNPFRVLPAVLFSLAASLSLCAQPAPGRAVVNIDRQWKFLLGDAVGAQAPSFDDAAWSDINLPHSFSVPYFRSPQFYVGYGWYRRHIRVEKQDLLRQTFIEFEGVFQEAEVFVNGLPVGVHRGGYTGFSMNVSKAIHAGDNVVAVRVNNRWNAQLNPRAGEHVFSGGIYRDVSLVTVEPVHVTWYGTFVTAPEVSKTSATVHIETEVENSASKPVTATILTVLLDPNGTQVAQVSSQQEMGAGATVKVEQQGPRLADPKLWSPDHPALYTAASRISVGDKLEDEYRTTFGIRSIQWTAEKGFFLNGEHLYFHGVDVHQDHAGWGDAVTNAAIARDVKLVKEAGFDFIRGSHYPHDPSFADACDRQGVLFWSENSFWGTGGFGSDGYWTASAYPVKPEDQAPFEQSVRDSLREMIRINRNHPSIVVWSLTNEVFFSDRSVWPKMRSFLAELVKYSHELDPTRPAGLGGVQRGGLDKIGDVAGYNGDGARLFIDPGVPNAVTEYGSAEEKRPGTYDPHWHDLQTTQFAWRSGQALWAGFDYGTIFDSVGTMGIVDYFRVPKRAWYWYRNEYAHVAPPEWPREGIPAALRLTGSDGRSIAHADGTGDVQLMATVVDAQGKPISNSPTVTLTIESGPGEFPTGRTITFEHDTDIDIRDGVAAIELHSYYSGKTVIRASSPGLPDSRIEIQSAGAPEFVAGKTPLFLPPPYVGTSGVAAHTAGLQELSRDRPTRASSEAKGHNGALANDGSLNTFWAAAGPGEAWFDVELERDCELSRVQFVLPFAGKVKYAIQVSRDLKDWTTVVERQESASAMQERQTQLPAGTRGEAVRLVFESIPQGIVPALTEMKVYGSVRGGS